MQKSNTWFLPMGEQKRINGRKKINIIRQNITCSKWMVHTIKYFQIGLGIKNWENVRMIENALGDGGETWIRSYNFWMEWMNLDALKRNIRIFCICLNIHVFHFPSDEIIKIFWLLWIHKFFKVVEEIVIKFSLLSYTCF